VRKLNAVFLAIGLLQGSEGCATEPLVKSYLDKESAGWAYKASDYAFVAEEAGCRIQWNAEEDKEGVRRLLVRRDCPASFAEQIPLHRAILKAISQRWPLPSFKSMAWGPLCMDNDITLCRTIIQSSLKSKDYVDYYKHYPHSKLKSLNGLFMELANKTQSYAPMAGLLREFGADIRLIAVEKVFEARLDDASLADELKPFAPKNRRHSKAMVDAGSWYFSLSAAAP